MSDGDEEPTDAPEDESAESEELAVADEAEATGDEGEDAGPSVEASIAAAEAAIEGDDADEDALNEALDSVEAAIEAAETEADLDDVESTVDDVAEAVGSADLPEPDEDDDEAEDPRGDLEARIDDLREAIEEARGPYAEDVIEQVQAAKSTVTDTRWTETGEAEAAEAVEAFIASANEALAANLSEDLAVDGDAPDALAEALDDATAAIDDADLDPDEDSKTVAALVEAADALDEGVEAAEAWEDLTTREQLEAEGFYDVLGHTKDYPPEWSALKEHEKRGNADMILLALEMLGSEFMEEHCLDALRRMGPEEAIEPMLARAERRDKPAIEILGKIASAEAVDAIVEYVDTDSDPQLQKTTLKALGEIGSEEATQAVANKLVAENEGVRSHAARSLGMIGDPRAVEPLADVLEDDESDTVRASAAWALVQIATEGALEAASEYADDRAYLVSSEAERAVEALGAKPA